MAKDTVDDLLGSLLGDMLGGGWNDLDNLGARAKAAQTQMTIEDEQRRAVERAIIADGLSPDEGKRRRLLVLLARKTLLRGPSPEELAPPSSDLYAIAKARREGENGVVLMLMSALAGDTPETEETA